MTNPEFSYPPIDLPIREAIWAQPSPVPQQQVAAVGAWCFPGEASDDGEVEDDGEERSWHEYSRLLAAMGLTASPGALKALPLLTEFSPALHELLSN